MLTKRLFIIALIIPSLSCVADGYVSSDLVKTSAPTNGPGIVDGDYIVEQDLAALYTRERAVKFVGRSMPSPSGLQVSSCTFSNQGVRSSTARHVSETIPFQAAIAVFGIAHFAIPNAPRDARYVWFIPARAGGYPRADCSNVSANLLRYRGCISNLQRIRIGEPIDPTGEQREVMTALSSLGVKICKSNSRQIVRPVYAYTY